MKIQNEPYVQAMSVMLNFPVVTFNNGKSNRWNQFNDIFDLTHYIQTIIFTCNQFTKLINEIFFFFFYWVFEIWYGFHADSTS